MPFQPGNTVGFKPGNNANPHGRPPAEQVRDFVGGKNEKLMRMLDALAMHQTMDGKPRKTSANPRAQVEAAKLLYTAARLIGTHIQIEGTMVPLFTLPLGSWPRLGNAPPPPAPP